MSEPLVVTRHGAAAVRPTRNAMTAGMWAALPGVPRVPAWRPRGPVLVVTGACPSFCGRRRHLRVAGGADPLDPMADLRLDNLAAQAALRLPEADGRDDPRHSCRWRCRDRRRVRPALHRPHRAFGLPRKVGIVYPPASIRPLIDLVGPATAKYLLLSGESIDADTALRTGLVDRLVASTSSRPRSSASPRSWRAARR